MYIIGNCKYSRRHQSSHSLTLTLTRYLVASPLDQRGTFRQTYTELITAIADSCLLCSEETCIASSPVSLPHATYWFHQLSTLLSLLHQFSIN